MKKEDINTLDDLKAYAAIDRIPIGIASFLSSVVVIGFAYIVKHVCEAKD